MASTIALAGSVAQSAAAAVEELAQNLLPVRPAFVLAFHSPRLPAPEVAEQLRARFPGACTVGCTTTGEILDGRELDGAVVALGMGGEARAAVEAIPDLGAWRYAEGPALLGRLTDRLGLAPSDLHPERHLLLVFADGLSGGDELLLAALRELAPTVPLVGASAADDMRFDQTWTFHNGRAHPHSAVVILLEPGRTFRTFAAHHYAPRGDKVVVTRSDPARRLLLELDGWPAVQGLARIAGADADALRAAPEAISALPVQLARRGPDGLRLRATMSLRGDALVMAGAVEEGAILDVVEGRDIVAATSEGVGQALSALPAAAEAMLLFNCGGRRTIARVQGLSAQTSRAMCQVPAVGMCSYGEYHGARLLNLTLTGVVFGQAPPGEGRGGDGVRR